MDDFYGPMIEFAPGVRRRTTKGRFDEYRGGGDALVDAGLLTQQQLPGRPGCPGKFRATFWPDGTKKGNVAVARPAGSKVVCRVGRSDRYVMELTVDAAEALRRRKLRDDENEARNQRNLVMADALLLAIRGRAAAAAPARKLPPGWRLIVNSAGRAVG